MSQHEISFGEDDPQVTVRLEEQKRLLQEIEDHFDYVGETPPPIIFSLMTQHDEGRPFSDKQMKVLHNTIDKIERQDILEPHDNGEYYK